MSNKNLFGSRQVDSALSQSSQQTGSLGNQSNSNNNPRYSLSGNPSGPRASLGPIKAGRISQTNGSQNSLPSNSQAEFSGAIDSHRKLSLTGRASYAAPESRNSISRRSSVYGKQSLGGGSVSDIGVSRPVGKDPRPVREKSYQYNCIKNLISYLAKAGYDKPISQKILTAPSSKDFQNIFKFLYAQLDPTYEYGKKFEDEVPGLLKGLRYPYAGDISKSQLYAVGSMHAWPSLLAMLNWMVELILCCDELNERNYAEDTAMLDVGEMSSADSSPEKIFFDYLCKTYKLFLAGSDDFEGILQEMNANFDRQNEIVLNDVQRLSLSVAGLEKEYQSFVSEESPLNKAEREKNIYSNDIEKFKKFILHLSTKKQKIIESIDRSVAELQDLERDLQDSELQRTSLQAQVDAQDIKPEDIDKMNADKEILVKMIESLTQAKEEASKIFWDREVQVQKKLDAVEKLVQEYNYGCEKSGLIPVEAQNSGGITFELYFNPHALKTEQMFNLEIKEHIQNSLLKLRDGYNATIHEAQSSILELQEVLDRLNESVNDKVEELKGLEEKIRKINHQYSDDKELFIAENKKSNEEIDTLDQDLQKMRTDMSSSYLQSQQALQKITIQYDQTVSKTAEEKERVAKEIFRILEELINFKTHIEGSLAEMNDLVKRELGQN